MSVKVESHFGRIAAEIRPKVSTGTRRGAELVMEGAKERVPVRSGDLRDAIHVDFRGDADYAVVAGNSKVFYGHMVEHGTTRAAPHPFLVPALEERRTAVEAMVKAALRSL